jgi:hypothetical protein
MTSYYPFWVLLIALSLLASLGGFLWAYRHRQFADQDRARYLPLRNEGARAAVSSGRRINPEVAAMIGVLAIGVMGLFATLAVVILTRLVDAP